MIQAMRTIDRRSLWFIEGCLLLALALVATIMPTRDYAYAAALGVMVGIVFVMVEGVD